MHTGFVANKYFSICIPTQCKGHYVKCFSNNFRDWFNDSDKHFLIDYFLKIQYDYKQNYFLENNDVKKHL